MQTRAQKYAALAYRHVAPVKEWKKEERQRYGLLCHRVPIMVLENGLVQAFAFLAAKGVENREEKGQAKPPEVVLLGHYAEALGLPAKPLDLQKEIVEAPLADYRRYTRTLLEASLWYKRLAQSLLKVDASGGTEGGEES